MAARRPELTHRESPLDARARRLEFQHQCSRYIFEHTHTTTHTHKQTYFNTHTHTHTRTLHTHTHAHTRTRTRTHTHTAWTWGGGRGRDQALVEYCESSIRRLRSLRCLRRGRKRTGWRVIPRWRHCWSHVTSAGQKHPGSRPSLESLAFRIYQLRLCLPWKRATCVVSPQARTRRLRQRRCRASSRARRRSLKSSAAALLARTGSYDPLQSTSWSAAQKIDFKLGSENIYLGAQKNVKKKEKFRYFFVPTKCTKFFCCSKMSY
jgi:hypothetical protein